MEDLVYNSEEITKLVKSQGFLVLEKELETSLLKIREEAEKQTCDSRDYLAGRAYGIQEYKRLITLILSKGDEARQIRKEK